MAAAKKTAKVEGDVKTRLAWTLAELKRQASARVRDEMGPRYGIVTKDKALGVKMSQMQAIAKQLGRDHELAQALWKTGVYEARMVASLVGEAEKVTPAEMEAWAKDFDNWGIVDTVCFKLWDETPYVFAKGAKWAKSKDEWIKRTGFVLVACGGLHGAGDEADYLKFMPLIEAGAKDERNFVKKGVSWALRAIGGKKSPKLRAAAREMAKRLAASDDPAQRWVGKDALRAFAKA